MTTLKTLSLALLGLGASATAYSQTYYSPNQIGLAMMRLNAVSLDHGRAPSYSSSGTIWAKIRSDFRMNEVNPELVRRHESQYASNSAYFSRTVERSRPYMYHIFSEVEKRNMPAEIALLPFIESAYVVKAKSGVGASGLWQFMPSTGRHYGLEQTPLYDGRHDVTASTDAALNYLQYLHGLFGDWSLALAAYNWGEGNVSRAIDRARAQGLDPVYENLKMPAETRNYVPKLMAVRNIVNNPQYFGMDLSEIDNKPYFKAVSVDQPIDVSAVSRLAGISEDEFRTLNPAFKQPVFVPNGNRKLLLPISSASIFEKNYRKADPSTLLTWNPNLSNMANNYASITEERVLPLATGNRSEIKAEIASLDHDLNPNDNALQAVVPLAVNTPAAVQTAALPVRITPPSDAAYYAGKPQIVPPQTRVATTAVAQSAAPAIVETRETAPALAVREPLPLPTQPYQKPEAAPQVAATAAAPVQTAQAASVQTPTPAQAAPVQTAQAAPAQAIPAAPLQTAQAAAAPAASVAEPVQTAQAAAPVAAPIQVAAADQADSQFDAAAAVRGTVSRMDAEEARAAKAAAARAKLQQRTEERLARATTQQQTVASGSHRVTDGDTLYNISQRYGISVADLVANNQIQGNNIRKGQVLNVAASASKPRAASAQQVSYTVRKGDTLTNIASRFNLNINDVRRWNGNANAITPGQRINLIGL